MNSTGDQVMNDARTQDSHAYEPHGRAPHGLDALLADPAALLHADRDSVREELTSRARRTAAAEDGRAVFRQAEAIFGLQDVPRAEFAAWLHFAATVLGRSAYADRIRAAAPDMPWSTEWAWWRPVGHYVADPNLSGDCSAAHLRHEGRELIQVDGLWCDDRWFDAHTGAPVDPVPEDEAEDWGPGRAAEEVLPVLFDEDPSAPALSVPPTWEYAEPLDTEGRYLIEEPRGIAVLRIHNDVLADWPVGGVSYESSEDGGCDLDPSPELGLPLTAARMDDTFGAGVRRVPEADLPAALEHGPTRKFLSGVGIPGWWAGGASGFSADSVPTPLDGHPDLLVLGSLDLGHDEGEVCVHRTTGTVHFVRSDEDGDGDGTGGDGTGGDDDGDGGTVVRLVRDVETFTLFLENLRRYMSASWDPYPEESGAEFEYESRMERLDPEAFADGAPSREIWEQVFAAITVLGVYGY
ncbi:SUKH-4 family immunity protein [Streptomyces sp. NPDC004111]|uniref:SUKH-4 family immunity protein n=1 Tax=Streptomyces sp. NPDC004111 TaxID=3364690 RepID=UPI0036C84D5A